MQPFSPQSDQHLISPYKSNTVELNKKVGEKSGKDQQMKESWSFDKFSTPVP